MNYLHEWEAREVEKLILVWGGADKDIKKVNEYLKKGWTVKMLKPTESDSAYVVLEKPDGETGE